MNRRMLGTILLAGLVIVGTSGASGGCGGSGGDGGTSAPAVGEGGEQSAPSEQHSTSAEHTSAEPSDEDHPSGEKEESGKSPCVFAPDSLERVGKKVTGKGHVICHEEPEMLGGSLVLAFRHYEGGNWEFVEDSRIGFTSLDIGKELTVSTNCNEGEWLMYFEASGTDHKGKGFTEPMNWPFPPRKVDSCP
jgi:hypothetical protein